MTTILEAEKLQFYYQDGKLRRIILDDLNVGFDRSTFYAITGPSGSGKSTLLSLLSGFDLPTGGRILYEGKDIQNSGLQNHRRNHVSIVFQNYNLISYLTALENVLEVMTITDNPLPKNKKNVAYNLLDYLGITRDRADRRVNQLSGGEQQRVAIARALSTNVDVILADEPTGNLNAEMSEEIVKIFQDLARNHGKTVIVMTHDMEMASAADCVLSLENGKLI